MCLQVGNPAPQFEATAYVRGDTEPRSISTAEFRGQWLVLFFYPRDFTFICPTELQAFAEMHAEFAREHAVVLAASTDSYYSHKAWFENDHRLGAVGFPVIADTSHALSTHYGVLLEDGAALRGTFIIDPEGMLRYAQINDLSVGRNVDETLRILRALRTGGLCPVSWRPGQPTLDSRTRTPDAVAA